MTQRLAVFASGGGSNLQALIDRFQRDDSAPLRIALVVSDRAGAGALDRARAAGIPAALVEVTGREPQDIADDTLRLLDTERIDMIALAGYLRLVPGGVVARFRGRIANIHPALLPAFGGRGMYGMNVHRAVIASGACVSGATVHLVDENYDEGRIIAQWPVPVLRDDTPEALAARVLRLEHLLYPTALERIARTAGERHAAGLAGIASFTATPADAPDPDVLRRTLQLD